MGTPIVQIVHYSDLHIVGPDHSLKRALVGRMKHHLWLDWQQGLEGAERDVLLAFEDFLKTDIAGDADWAGCPIWLVDTGDGTTFGDDVSLDTWLNDWSVRFRNACRGAQQLILYGNHDTWPQTHPLLAPKSMERRRDELRAKWFTDRYPTVPLREPIPGGGGSEVQLFAVNSVLHGAIENIRAIGAVRPDRFWEAQQTQKTAVEELQQLAHGLSSPGGGAPVPHLRIVAMHYPVAENASPGCHFNKILINRDQFATEVGNCSFGSPPMFPVFLAGHTHASFPCPGLLPRSATFVEHKPFPPGIIQLVSGSLSQTSLAQPGKAMSYLERLAFDYPFRASVLRLSVPARQTNEISIQRITVGCRRGGAFEALPIVDGGSCFSEDFNVVI